MYEIKSAGGNPLKHTKKRKKKQGRNKVYRVEFSNGEAIYLYFKTSSIGCCLKGDKRLVKLYERGTQLVNKEFDVLQLFKSKKHDHIKKKPIDIDVESGGTSSEYSNSEDEAHYYDPVQDYSKNESIVEETKCDVTRHDDEEK